MQPDCRGTTTFLHLDCNHNATHHASVDASEQRARTIILRCHSRSPPPRRYGGAASSRNLTPEEGMRAHLSYFTETRACILQSMSRARVPNRKCRLERTKEQEQMLANKNAPMPIPLSTIIGTYEPSLKKRNLKNGDANS
jgi:hypothetical protein